MRWPDSEGIPDEVQEVEHGLAMSFEPIERRLLWRLLLYYNGLPIAMPASDQKRVTLGISRPPSICELAAVDQDWHPVVQDAVERLRTLDLFHDPKFICRTEVPFCPTQTGRSVLDELFGGVWPTETGAELDNWEAIEKETSSVLVGEQNEGLVHRYGVWQFVIGFRKSANRMIVYPTGAGSQPDVLLELPDLTGITAVIEVQTGHNDHEQIAAKYRGLREFASSTTAWPQPVTINWHFPTAAIAARTINILQRRVDEFDVPTAPFDRPDNYRLNRLDDLLADKRASCDGMDIITTYSEFRKS